MPSRMWKAEGNQSLKQTEGLKGNGTRKGTGAREADRESRESDARTARGRQRGNGKADGNKGENLEGQLVHTKSRLERA